MQNFLLTLIFYFLMIFIDNNYVTFSSFSLSVTLEELLIRITQTLKSDPDVWDIYAGKVQYINDIHK